MITAKQIVVLSSMVWVASCSPRTDRETFEHQYAKYWDKYSEVKLIDTLYSDTLMVGPDSEDGSSARVFYINTINELVADLHDDRGNIDSLYPMAAFDELTIQKLPFGFKKTFTNEQAARFLEILNDPVSFDWAETTYEPEFQIDLLKNNKSIASLTIGADNSVIKTNPDWPAFKKFKFGHLKPERCTEMNALLKEVID